MRVLAAGVAGLLLITAVTAASAEGLREGQWEYRSTMQVPGMPALPRLPEGLQLPQTGPQGMSMTYRHCVSAADPVPRDPEGMRSCKTTRLDRQGNTLHWAATCTTPYGTAEAEGQAQYQGDRMEGRMQLRGRDGRGQPFAMTQQLSGRYLGPCPAP
ncbi:MAG TPA: DUF3617 family protein [Solimonas sp.]|nr:DUF3617 family protein [Solimonas sp.]